MKPIATVSNALPSFDLRNLGSAPAHVERSDTCAVPAAGVVLEAMIALALADALLESFGGDSMEALRIPLAKGRMATRTDLGHAFLIGPMGAGKSSVGAALAKATGKQFIDLDARIEQKSGAKVADIFANQGEEAFRALEAEALDAVANEPAAIVSLGGGAALTERAWRAMRRAGLVIALTGKPEALAQRIEAEGRGDRPLLAGGDAVEKLTEIMRIRARWYDRADFTIETTDLSVEACVGAVQAYRRLAEGGLASRARHYS